MSAGSVRRALVTGADGQVGRALRARVPAGWELVSCGSRTLDVTDRANVLATIGRERPAVVINAAAYTAVDRAEGDAGNASYWYVRAQRAPAQGEVDAEWEVIVGELLRR